jgi:hypothetical protein
VPDGESVELLWIGEKYEKLLRIREGFELIWTVLFNQFSAQSAKM